MANSPKPCAAIHGMAPFSLPSGRGGKLRLDLNENTVGCSPRVIDAIQGCLDREVLGTYPEYSEGKEAIAQYFQVAPERLLFTNGTGEAIHLVASTYVDAGQEVVLLKPRFSMYRFYSKAAGAKIVEVEYAKPGMEFPLQELLDAITPETRA